MSFAPGSIFIRYRENKEEKERYNYEK